MCSGWQLRCASAMQTPERHARYKIARLNTIITTLCFYCNNCRKWVRKYISITILFYIIVILYLFTGANK